MCSAEEALSLRLYGYFGTTIKPMTITMANPNHTPYPLRCGGAAHSFSNEYPVRSARMRQHQQAAERQLINTMKNAHAMANVDGLRLTSRCCAFSISFHTHLSSASFTVPSTSTSASIWTLH